MSFWKNEKETKRQNVLDVILNHDVPLAFVVAHLDVEALLKIDFDDHFRI